MITLTKERLLELFPYRELQPGVMVKNESIYDVFNELQELLWGAVNQNGDIALRLFDYQGDVAQRLKHFNAMRDELPEALKKKAEEYAQKQQQTITKYCDPKRVEQYMKMGQIPWHVADDPKAFEEAYTAIKEKYEEVDEKRNEIEEKFREKMEGIEEVKLNNTDHFTRADIKNLPGKLVKAVRPLLKSADPEPKDARKKVDRKGAE